jgi:5-methylcytosine-specific restriction endonuclease McrA
MFKCKYCGKEFEGRKRKFCSKICMVKSTNINPSTKNCKHCNKPFEVKRSKYTYCSDGCSKEAHKKQQSNRTKRPDYHKVWFDKNQDKRIEYDKQRLIRDQEKRNRRLLAGEIEGESSRIYIKQCRGTGKLFVTRDRYKIYINKEISDSQNAKINNSKLRQKKCRQCNEVFKGKQANYLCKSCSRKNNKIHSYNSKNKRRSREKGISINRKIVFESFGWICRHCGTNTYGIERGKNLPNEATIDHIIPLSKGGLHNYSNVQLLCRRCNTKKRDTIPQGAPKSSILNILETIGHPFFSVRNV